MFQVVFLLDLDSVLHDSASKGILARKTKALRAVLLKFLTFFASEHCTSEHINASFSLKWDCKYYISSVSKSIRQRCTFKDFNLENYEKFENELEEKLEKCRSEREAEQHQQSTSSIENCLFSNLDSDVHLSASSCQGDKTLSFKTIIHNLELALKDIVCDYTWDQPYVCSPLRKTRQQQQNGKSRRKSTTNDTAREVENIVIVITGVPRLHTQLDGFVDGKKRLTPSGLLDKILPQSLYKQFVQISKIRLFWLDTSDVVQTYLDSEIDSSKTRAIFELFHQALRTTGGGLIPLNALLPTWYTDNEVSKINKHIPAGLAFQMPIASLMSGYLTDARGIADKQAQARIYSRLHLNLGTEESKPVIYELELLPLFKSNISSYETSVLTSQKRKTTRISCTNEAIKARNASNVKTMVPEKHCTVTCTASKEETDLCYIPRDIRIIGTVLLHEIHSQLIAKPSVYMCCSVDSQTVKNQSNMDSLDLQQILMELAAKQIALLVSCDDLSQGIFFPSNSRCEIALLYVLASEGEASIFTQKAEPASIPKDISSFIHKSLEISTNFSPQKRTPKTNSKSTDVALSSSFLEKWFIPHPSHKSTLSDMKAASFSSPSELHMAQKTIFKSLQKAYLPSLMNTKLQEPPSEVQDASSYCDQLRRSPRLKRDSQLNAISPVSKLLPQSIQKAHKNRKGTVVSDNGEANKNHSTGSRSSLKIRTSILNEEISASGVCEQVNENDMLTKLMVIYKNAISGDSAVISIAQTVLDVCLVFYNNQNRINVKMCTRDAIFKHFLMKPGDVDSSNGTKEVVKKWKIREHCFQSIIRLELLEMDSSKTEEYVTDIIAHLRKLSFIAGPSTLSSFLQDTLVENYYSQLREAVAEICEDLNQPLPYDDIKFSPSSSNDGLLSPEKPDSITTSGLSHMSIMSSNSSSSNQSKAFKLKRSEAVTRYPSFGDLAHKRKIVISQGNSKRHSLHITSNTGPLTRSAQKKRKETLTGSKSASGNVRRTLFKHGFPTTKKHTTPSKPQKPTTPKGRHVLRTKNVSDTPIHKQVDQPTLRRQSLKRKRTLEIDGQEDEIVEESPDKQPDPSYSLRRTSKRHASTLRREASFYSVCLEPKAEQAMASNITSSKTPLRRSSRKLVQMACLKITPDRKLKAKRVLILSDTSEKPMSKTTPKKAFNDNFSPYYPRRSDRLSGIEATSSLARTPTQLANSSSPRLCEKQESKCTPTGSSRKSPRLSKSCMLDFKDSPRLQHSLTKPKSHEMPNNHKVSRRLLQTPLKSESRQANQNSVSKTLTSTSYDEDVVPSTPTRNGLESPRASPTHVFLYGPLAGNLDDCLSRSSSPIIPLLSNETIEFYEDQNQCASFGTPFDATVAEKSDYFHTCLDTEVNFSQYFSSNDAQISVKGILQDAIVPSEELARETTKFMFTPNKPYRKDTGSPHCALPSWETQNGFNCAFGLLTKHTHDFQDITQKTPGSLGTIQFSSGETTNAFEESCSSIFDVFNSKPSEENVPKTKPTSSCSNDCYSLQRFTRQASKELGISLKEFKILTSELSPSEKDEEASKIPDIKLKSTIQLPKATYATLSPSPSKFNKPIIKSNFTPPTEKSLFHLTNSPILSSVSTRTTRYSLKRQVQIEPKDKRV